MMYPEIPLAQQIVLACKAKNIRHIVLSPGSRNAPLTIGFTTDSFFTCYSIVDERSAGFFALGISQQLSKPVAVVCTSGSAVLNYYPAVSEAFYSNTPLVVISADRPTDKIDIGDGQTIRQVNVLANHTIYNANLSEQTNLLKYNEEELNKALNIAFEKQLPVHINVPFEEPLYRTTYTLLPFENQTNVREKEKLSEAYIQHFLSDWATATKKMILVGTLKPNSLAQKWVEFLSQDPSVIVLTETTSNMVHSSHFQMIDTLLVPVEVDTFLKEKLRPEMLISFGGMIVSKKIKEFLRENRPKSHYHIDPYVGYDTYFCLTHHFKTDIESFFEQIGEELPIVSSEYKPFWQNFIQNIYQKREAYLSNIPYSDMAVYQAIFQSIGQEYQVQISNSSAIRYAQLFPSKSSWEVFCNRGTSGIDGSTSTAIGASIINSKPTIFITGDLSFFYNSNALWCAYTPTNFRLILINNDGGGIFRILPTDKELPVFESFFETPHGLSAEYLCQMYGWEYTKASDLPTTKMALADFFNPSQCPKLLEVFTPRKINDKILLEYFSYLKK
ncbi:2-succinyl-5-enolpyruvyl-6-hydroxy-3-cyclohexene-1-carboxylic-acid synthase [Capnocytophaga catalasegens]|nr:2-succinyl-5-enolpyruvyl-6-hydroxy-3-cyclohexene-1-carboxylic-acid synthase [Capnocytophaga catalasegens]